MKRGTGAASTVEELMGSELWDPPAQDVGWERDGAGAQSSQGRQGSLSWASGCKAAQGTLGWGFIALPEGLLTCEEPALHLGEGFLGPQKKGRKENAAAYGFD